MLILRKRFTLAAWVATLALLALPSLASANPGTGPELVQRSGRFVVMHADRHDGTSTEQWALDQRHGALPVARRRRRHGSIRARRCGSRARWSERRARRGRLAERGHAARAVAAAAQAGSRRRRRCAARRCILFGFAGNPTSASLTDDRRRGRARSSSTRPGRAPSARTTRSRATASSASAGEVYGPFNIPASSGLRAGRYQHWCARARNMAGIAERHVPALRRRSFRTCPRALGGAGGDRRQERLGQRRVHGQRLAHELGHNLGLVHAGGSGVHGGRTPVPRANCATPTPYGDPFDTMGAPGGRAPDEHAAQARAGSPAGFGRQGGRRARHLPPRADGDTPGAAGVLRIPRPGGGNYYVEYRYPIGYFDSQAPCFRACSSAPRERRRPPTRTRRTRCCSTCTLRPTASGATPRWTSAQVFSDPLSGISIQNLAQDASGASLQIRLRATRAAERDDRPHGGRERHDGAARWAPASDDYQVDSYVVTA